MCVCPPCNICDFWPSLPGSYWWNEESYSYEGKSHCGKCFTVAQEGSVFHSTIQQLTATSVIQSPLWQGIWGSIWGERIQYRCAGKRSQEAWESCAPLSSLLLLLLLLQAPPPRALRLQGVLTPDFLFSQSKFQGEKLLENFTVQVLYSIVSEFRKCLSFDFGNSAAYCCISSVYDKALGTKWIWMKIPECEVYLQWMGKCIHCGSTLKVCLGSLATQT